MIGFLDGLRDYLRHRTGIDEIVSYGPNINENAPIVSVRTDSVERLVPINGSTVEEYTVTVEFVVCAESDTTLDEYTDDVRRAMSRIAGEEVGINPVWKIRQAAPLPEESCLREDEPPFAVDNLRVARFAYRVITQKS